VVNYFSSSTTTSNYISHAEWNGHKIITSDAFEKPQKIYKDSTGVFRLRTAGLPKLASSPTITARCSRW